VFIFNRLFYGDEIVPAVYGADQEQINQPRYNCLEAT
jgi:hypothetical protein